MPTVKQLQETRAPIGAEIRKMAETLTGDKKDFAAEERGKWDKLNADFNDLTKQIEFARQAEQVESELSRSGVSVPGLEDRAAKPADRTSAAEREERDREIATRSWFLRQAGRELSEEQRDACKRVGFNPSSPELSINLPRQQLRPDVEKRANLTVGTTTDGGHTVPQGFVYQLEKSMLAFNGPRQVADVLRTDSGNDLPWPTVNDTGNVGALLAEQTTFGASVAPSFGRVVFQAFKYSSTPAIISVELLEDSAFDMAREIPAMLGERIGRIQATHFTTGAGTTEPQGIVTGSSAGKTTASATAIKPEEIIDLIHSVDPAYRNDPSFRLMAHDLIWAYVRKLKDGNGRFIYESNTDGGPDRVHGVPIVVNQSMASTVATTNKTMLAGAMRKFKIRDVRQIRVRRLDERYADFDQVGFVAFLRSDSHVLDAGTDPIKHLVQA